MSAGTAVNGDARSGVDELLAAAILVVDGRELSGRDLLAAGVVSGRWQRLERELADGLGLAAARPPDETEVAEAVRAFRVERGLLSGEDLRAWLKERRLTLESIKAAAARALARLCSGTSEEVAPGEIAVALPAEAICTGALGEMGVWLADRILSAATSGVGVESVTLERSSVQRLVFEEARTVAGGVSREPGVERAARLGWIAALDDAHREWVGQVTGAGKVMRRLREKQLEWSWFRLEEFRLDSAGAATEAARQLAEGIEPGRIAAAAGVPPAARRVVLADAHPELARMLSGAVEGDVVGPWSDGEAHMVARVRERRKPDVDDDQIVARAREDVLADAGARLRAGRVRWHDRA
jgi:hypothetical protein